MSSLTPNALGPNDAFTDAINIAYAATAMLSKLGIKVYAAMLRPERRPTLMVDALPDGMASVVKSRHPNGDGGTTVISATVYQGCQLEWMHDVYSSEQAARITRTLNGGKPALEVVREH